MNFLKTLPLNFSGELPATGSLLSVATAYSGMLNCVGSSIMFYLHVKVLAFSPIFVLCETLCLQY